MEEIDGKRNESTVVEFLRAFHRHRPLTRRTRTAIYARTVREMRSTPEGGEGEGREGVETGREGGHGGE